MFLPRDIDYFIYHLCIHKRFMLHFLVVSEVTNSSSCFAYRVKRDYIGLLYCINILSFELQDENRYNAGRGSHVNLKRAERARVTISKIPGIFLSKKTLFSSSG